MVAKEWPLDGAFKIKEKKDFLPSQVSGPWPSSPDDRSQEETRNRVGGSFPGRPPGIRAR